jgi:hypothetical protein
MRGRSNKGYRRSKKIQAIEGEFDMTFPEVLAGFAADGLNKNQTAAVLEFDRATFYRRVRDLEARGYVIDWPCGYATRAKPHYPNTPAQQAANRANLQRVNKDNARPWGNATKATAAMMQRAVELRRVGNSWHSVAYALGIDISTLRRARKKHNTPDPLGDVLIEAAQRAFTNRSL